MLVLLDECVPKRLGRHLDPHKCRIPAQLGWDGIKNGRLLSLAESEFDVLVTMDRNLSFQQSLPKFRIALVVLRARSNRLGDLLPLVPQIISAISSAQAGAVLVVGE
jgi:hypothetical protein